MGDCFLEDGVHSSLILMARDGFDGPDGFQMDLRRMDTDGADAFLFIRHA